MIADDQGRYVVVLADFNGPAGEPPDGRVDRNYTFTSLQGRWPFEARFEGPVVIEEYGHIDTTGPRTVGIVMPTGLVQFLPGFDQSFRDPSAVATIPALGIGGGVEFGSFDDVEGRQVAIALQNASRRPGPGTPPPGTVTTVTTTDASPGIVVQSQSGPAAPVRVGGNVKAPVKVHHVDPIYPEVARDAQIRGVVIVELTIGEDGQVQNARVLRSIPFARPGSARRGPSMAIRADAAR